MLNDTEKAYIKSITKSLPERKAGKRGPKPIPQEVILTELFKKFKHNLRWRDLSHPTVCYNYFSQLQARGLLKKLFNNLVSEQVVTRPAKTIVDSSDMESYRTNRLVSYSGKYHNYCMKMTVEVTEDLIPIGVYLHKGTTPDSTVLDQILSVAGRLNPYELFLDKGYEKYGRRRELKKSNCQVRMEMKKVVNSRKRGPRFVFTEEHKKIRGSIEKVYGWLKSFAATRFNRLRRKSLIMGKLLFCLSYIAFMRLAKL